MDQVQLTDPIWMHVPQKLHLNKTVCISKISNYLPSMKSFVSIFLENNNEILTYMTVISYPFIYPLVSLIPPPSLFFFLSL